MRKLFILILLILSCAAGLRAQTMPFSPFDAERIDVGTLYIYEYSRNEEQFKPRTKEYFYLKTLNEIEQISSAVEDTTADWIETSKLNWNYMMLAERKWISLTDEEDLNVGAGIRGGGKIDFAKKIFSQSGKQKEKEGIREWSFVNKLKSLPTYFYQSTGLMPLWFALRFYPLDKTEITLNSNANGYNIKFKIKYIGKEEVRVPYGNVPCHKFELVLKMSYWMKLFYKPKQAFFWLSSKDSTRYMVQYRNDNEQNSFNRSIEYRLAERRKMTLAEWNELKEEKGVDVRKVEEHFSAK